jgi:hypothetical protein
MRHRRVKTAAAVITIAVGVAFALSACTTQFGATLLRPQDPVVMQGSALPALLGADPVHVVAFAYDGSAFQQVPVQVDQRDFVNPGHIYNRPMSAWANLAGGGGPFTILVYTPPPASPGYTNFPTYTPADHDPTLDANDEVSFLGSDLGKAAPAGVNPPGVTTASRVEVHATDPLVSGAQGYLYLYKSTSLFGGAKTSGVTYTFSLDSGDYKTTYKMGTASNAPNNVAGANPEHSTIVAPGYHETYNDRWVNDGLTINAPGASGADLLDRAIYPVPNAGCARSEDTYDDVVPSSPYEGAFIANISGPVRAIRSHIGANSFTYTTQTEYFYPNREDSTIDLRGHAGLPGYASYDDVTTNLAGMRYFDNLNTGGVPIDGVGDAITPANQTTPIPPGPPNWQLVTGPAGSLVTTRSLTTTLVGARVQTWYVDQAAPQPKPCTGDSASWGDSGLAILAPSGQTFVNTDPTLGVNPPTLSTTRFRYFGGPGFTPADAAAFAARAANPIAVSVSH